MSPLRKSKRLLETAPREEEPATETSTTSQRDPSTNVMESSLDREDHVGATSKSDPTPRRNALMSNTSMSKSPPDSIREGTRVNVRHRQGWLEEKREQEARHQLELENASSSREQVQLPCRDQASMACHCTPTTHKDHIVSLKCLVLLILILLLLLGLWLPFAMRNLAKTVTTAMATKPCLKLPFQEMSILDCEKQRTACPYSLDTGQFAFLSYPDYTTYFKIREQDVDIDKRPWSLMTGEVFELIHPLDLVHYYKSVRRSHAAYWHPDKDRGLGRTISDSNRAQILRLQERLFQKAVENASNEYVNNEEFRTAAHKARDLHKERALAKQTFGQEINYLKRAMDKSFAVAEQSWSKLGSR